MMEIVGDRVGKRRAEYRDRRREDHARGIVVAERLDGVEQPSRAVEIDPVAFVEIRLGLAGHDGREVEDHVGPRGDQRCGDAGPGKVRGERLDVERRVGRLGRCDNVDQCRLVDRLAAEIAVFDQARGQFRADHARGANNQNVHLSVPRAEWPDNPARFSPESSKPPFIQPSFGGGHMSPTSYAI